MNLKAKLLIVMLSVLLINTTSYGFRFSVGGFGGLNIPIAQEDTESGTAFGAKARIPLLGSIGIEPNIMWAENGDAQFDIEGGWNTSMEHEGGKYTSFGVDLVFGSIQGYKGFGAYGILGYSSSKFEKKGIPDLTEGTYWLGLGFEYGFTDQISLDVRGKAFIFPYKDETNPNNDDKGSRKNGLITVGLNYYFGFTE
ncbi:MAG: outer membrane beta-barrel protein [Candidatus Zixiibacteriota bacterium]